MRDRNKPCSATMILGLATLVMVSSFVSAGEQQPIKVARGRDKAKLVIKGGKLGPSDSPIRKPQVILSEGHKSTCVKLVGDKIGNLNVTDIDNKTHKLHTLLSDKFTVLVFWHDNSRAGVEQFRRIPVDILGKYAKHRVKVIAANVSGHFEKTKTLTGDAADKVVSLVDKDQLLFRAFANTRCPRTYLLDKDGKILWFDIEYSQSMQRELENALHYYLMKSSS